ncbi:MAG: recombinase family protein, partial [Chloroflexi bacterium]|nr:recombinase family protein [Chloroflexota bacterium]
MKAAIYARVSSDSQDVDLSISAQLRAVRDYATKHEYETVREYVDEAESGRNASRPAFREMIALAKTKNPPFSAILVWKLNRFSRSRVDSVTYKTLLKNKGIRVISINEHLDESPSGQLLEGIIESVDEFYSANLGQDIKRGLRENAARGFYSIGRAPYGFHKAPVRDGAKTRYKLEPDPEESISMKVISRMFGMALKGIGCKQIAVTLNREGFLTSTGERWGKTTVHKVLTNEAYCGTLVFGGRPGHAAIHSSEPPVRVENAWQPIIDKDTFRQVQSVMSNNAPKAVHPRIVPSFYLLSGILFCACGSAMVGRSAKSHRYYYYTCNRNSKQGREACEGKILPKEKIERLVIDQIKSKILVSESLEQLVVLVNAELDAGHTIVKEKMDNIDIELHEVENRLTSLYDALETGKLVLDDLAPRIKELRTKQNELSKARVLAEAEMTLQGCQQLDIDAVRSYAADLWKVLEESEVAQRKAFLRSFVKKIVVENEMVKLYYKVPVPPDGKKMEAVGVLPI